VKNRPILIKFGTLQTTADNEPDDSRVTKNWNFKNSRWRTAAIFNFFFNFCCFTSASYWLSSLHTVLNC